MDGCFTKKKTILGWSWMCFLFNETKYKDVNFEQLNVKQNQILVE